MKILKKLLLVGLCSFVFCFSANALTSDYYTELKYSNELINLVEENQNKIDLIVNHANYNGVWGQPFNGKYIIAINMQTINTNNIDIRFIDMSLNRFDDFFSISNSYIAGDYMYSYFGFGYFGYYETYTITNNVITSTRNSAGQLSFSYHYQDYNCNPTQENCLLSIDNYYFYTDFLDEQYKTLNIQFNESPSITNIPLKFNNETYIQPTEFNLYNFLNSFVSVDSEQNVCDRTAVLGAVSNVNEIKLNVKGETSALAEPLKGTFTLNYSKDYAFSSDDFIVEFVNNSGVQVVGNYNFKCDDLSYNCYLNYEYNTSDDITETADFSFKIRSADNGIMPLIKIYSCTTNDDYTYISYDYTNGPSDSTTNNPSLENILTDSTPPDISGLGDMTGWLPPGPVDSILTLPLKMLQSITSFLSGTCTPVKYTLPFVNYETELSCMNEIYDKINATTFFELTGTIASTIILITYFTFLYNWIDGVLRLEHKKVKAWGAGEV